MATARLEVVVESSGVRSASKDLRELTSYSKETEKQNKRMADTFAEIAAAEEKEARKAVALSVEKAKAAQAAADKAADAADKEARNAVALSDKKAKQYEKDFAKLVDSEDKKAKATANAARRDAEMWNDAKQKALARYDKEIEAAEKAAKKKIDASEKVAKRENEIWNDQIQKAKARVEREGWGKDGVLPIRPSLQRIEAKINEPQAGVADKLWDDIGAKLGHAALAAGAVAAAYTGLSKVIAETSAYDGLIARLAGVAGGTEAAREQFDKLEKLSDKTIFSENAVTEAFIRMDQQGLKPTERTMQSFANIASATGNSIERVAEASTMAAMGTYRGLREFGVKAVQEGDKLKVTFKGVTTTIGSSADAITQYLVGIGENDFAGAAERQLDTMGGAVKKVEDAWGDLFREVGRSAVGDFIKTGMTEAAKAINFATEAFEGLMFTMSQKPKFTGMSAELAAFAKGASKWGAAKSDEEITLEDQVQAAITKIEGGRMSSNDKRQAEFQARDNVLQDALARGVGGDIEAAIAENLRQYTESVNGSGGRVSGKGKKKETYDQFMARLAEEERKARNASPLGGEEYRSEDDLMGDSYKDPTQSLTARLEKEIAAQEAAAEALADARYRQKSGLDEIGRGPQSQMSIINRKSAGDMHKMGGLLSDDLSGKNGEDLKLEAEKTYAQKSIAIEKERTEAIRQLNMDLAAQSTQNASLMFGSLANVMKNAHGEMSKEYQTMFAVQQAFGIAAAQIAMFQSMAEASKQPYPANIPLYFKAAAQGAEIINQISNTAYSGSYDSGGNIQDGRSGDVGERRPELLMVHGRSRVQGPATVIGGEATAALLGGGKQQPLSVRVVNAYDGDYAVSGFLGSTRGEMVLRNFVKKNGPLMRSLSR